MTYASDSLSQPRPRALAIWLLAVASIVFVMIVIGGITRLTESGLSIVHWSPISGVIPPLDQAHWDAEFNAYKVTPEGRMNIAAGMTMEGFKQIFFWEYLHRQIGRLIGLSMLLPLLWFAWKRAIPQGYLPRLVALFALVVFQGTIGWWMVASGLVDRPDVSHIRLAVHLLTALFFFGGLIWTALDLLSPTPPARMTGMAVAVLGIFAIQLLLGAFTAGLDAGFAFASWPLMGDRVFPEGGWNPALGMIANLVDNPVVVQFVHRWWAWVAAIAALLLVRRVRASLAVAPLLVGTLLIAQIALGVATLLTGVDIVIAVAHQAVAALLLAALVLCAHRLGSAR